MRPRHAAPKTRLDRPSPLGGRSGVASEAAAAVRVSIGCKKVRRSASDAPVEAADPANGPPRVGAHLGARPVRGSHGEAASGRGVRRIHLAVVSQPAFLVRGGVAMRSELVEDEAFALASAAADRHHT